MGSSGRHLATDDVPFIACIHGVRFAVFLNITYKRVVRSVRRG